MAFLKKLFGPEGKISLKRKPGGTLVGNMLRAIVKKQTDGALGNGAMMVQEGETTQDANKRMLEGLGSAAVAFSNTASAGVTVPESPDSPGLAAFTKGAKGQFIQKYAVWGLGGLAVLLVLKSVLNNNNKR